MAYEEQLQTLSLRATSTSYSTAQYRIVNANTTRADYFKTGTTNSTGTKSVAIGVLQDAPTVAGEACNIAYAGVTKIVVGSTALKMGSLFRCGSGGIAESSTSATGQETLYGPWLSAAQSTGSIGSALFRPAGITT